MTVAQLASLPINLRNRMGRQVIEEIEAHFYEEGGVEINAAADAADAHVPVAAVKAVARLN